MWIETIIVVRKDIMTYKQSQKRKYEENVPYWTKLSILNLYQNNITVFLA